MFLAVDKIDLTVGTFDQDGTIARGKAWLLGDDPPVQYDVDFVFEKAIRLTSVDDWDELLRTNAIELDKTAKTLLIRATP